MKPFWIVLVFISCSTFASDRILYCNGIFSFVPTKDLDLKFIKVQSGVANCKNELKIKIKNGRKLVKLSFPSESNQLSILAPTIEELNSAKGESDRVINQSYLVSGSNGDVKVETFIAISKEGVVETIEKDFYFSKKDVYSIYAVYKINPEDRDEVAMLNALSKSAKLSWNKFCF